MKAIVFASASVMAAAGVVNADLFKFKFELDGSQEVPPKVTPGSGLGLVEYDSDTNVLKWNISYQDLLAPTVAAHFHGAAPPGQNAPPVIDFMNFGGLESPIVGQTSISEAHEADLLAGLWYVNIHTSLHPSGEIRGQVVPGPGALVTIALATLGLARRSR